MLVEEGGLSLEVIPRLRIFRTGRITGAVEGTGHWPESAGTHPNGLVPDTVR